MEQREQSCEMSTRVTVDVDDSPAHTRCPLAGHHCQTPAPGRGTLRHGRVTIAKAPIDHQQPRAAAPNLNSFDRFVLGLGSLFVPANRFSKLAVVLKPRTLLRFHEALKKRKYRWLFSSGGHRRPGPKGPSKEL